MDAVGCLWQNGLNDTVAAVKNGTYQPVRSRKPQETSTAAVQREYFGEDGRGKEDVIPRERNRPGMDRDEGRKGVAEDLQVKDERMAGEASLKAGAGGQIFSGQGDIEFLIVVVAQSRVAEKWWKRTLDSVVSQDYSKWRLRVLHDGGDDVLREKFKEWEHGLRDDARQRVDTVAFDGVHTRLWGIDQALMDADDRQVAVLCEFLKCATAFLFEYLECELSVLSAYLER